MTPRFRHPSVLPGFGLTLGFAIGYLSLIVLILLRDYGWPMPASH